MKKWIFFFVFIQPFIVWGQTQPQIATGRPGQAIGPLVLGTGIFQIQSGLDYNRREFTNTKNTQRTLNNIIRLGLSEDFEISSIVDYRDETFETNGTETELDGLSQFQLGFRYNLIPESDGWIPALGFQTRFRLKQVSSQYRSDQVAPVMLLATSHNLTEDFSLGLNGGISYNGNTNIPQHNYVIGVSQKISSIFSTTYEFWGNEYNDTESSYLGFGVAYRMNRNTQWDVYVASGDNSGVKEFYFTVGISWRAQIFRSLNLED